MKILVVWAQGRGSGYCLKLEQELTPSPQYHGTYKDKTIFGH